MIELGQLNVWCPTRFVFAADNDGLLTRLLFVSPRNLNPFCHKSNLARAELRELWLFIRTVMAAELLSMFCHKSNQYNILFNILVIFFMKLY